MYLWPLAAVDLCRCSEVRACQSNVSNRRNTVASRVPIDAEYGRVEDGAEFGTAHNNLEKT